MRLPFTYKKLIAWAGSQTVSEAEMLVNKGAVLEANYEPPFIKGSILYNNRSFATSMKILKDGNVESMCPCRLNVERGIICAHVISLAIVLVKRATDPLREIKYQGEIRKAKRLAQFKDTDYIQREICEPNSGSLGSVVITIADDWSDSINTDKIEVSCSFNIDGKTTAIEDLPKNRKYPVSKQDDSILFVLEDICEGPIKNVIQLRIFDFINLLEIYNGKQLHTSGGKKLTVNGTKMKTVLKVDLDRENGEIILIAHTELPFMHEAQVPVYIVTGKSGWIFGADNFWPLENILPIPYHQIYKEPVIIPRPNVLNFFKNELPNIQKTISVQSDISLDLFTIEPAQPVYRLSVQGSPASLSATLHAQYGNIDLIACKPDSKEHFGIPDPDDLLRYTIRNPAAEKKALEILKSSGLYGETGDSLTSIVGTREVLNFLGSNIAALRRKNWQVILEGKVAPFMESLDYVTPVVNIRDSGDGSWFDIGFDFDDCRGQSLSRSEIQQAILKNESYIRKGDRTILIDTDAVNSMFGVFNDCASEESDQAGQFRMSKIYLPFIKSSLDTIDGIDIEEPPEWRIKAGRFNRTVTIEQVPLDESLDKILRPYQKEGVNWLYFLESGGFCGLLADEMGLGKTIQTLVWLQLRRRDAQLRGKASLIVCPTSLVQNWIEEAAKFTPNMKALAMSGSERHENWEKIKDQDIVVTSYALLRRDLDKYLQHEFSCAVLDEAQHIKNRSTQNAVSAKKIRAKQKLVLTGTPVENGVSDLWSIMDFLMPGYMGSHEAFKQNYESPITRGGPESEFAQSRLRKKLHPFILRRLKKEVAKELPPKIEKTAMCDLTRDQQLVYTELLQSSKKKITSLVSKNGFNKSRMEILAMIMRLRQVCCHLDLLGNPDLKSSYPSAKLDLFMELVDEAVDSGHRILVFSQFVSMLSILRKELEKEKYEYCYLDGSTKDRIEVVHKFNTSRDIPMFLISLKAGGTGLNLTGADMVIHFDPWWNPAVENQATDRAYRIGQKKTVYSIKLITKGTIEEKVLALQHRKQSVINAIVESDEAMVQSLSWDDIQELLTI